MNFEFNYPESPVFVIAKAVDEGLTRLTERDRSGQLGADYLVNPKAVQHTCLTWFGLQVATRIPVEEIYEALDLAFAFFTDARQMEQLREYLILIGKRAPNADVPTIATQVADVFKLNEITALLILGIRYSILRKKG